MTDSFVGVDWGTSSFRLWLMQMDGVVLGESRSSEGMLHCAESGFAPVLEKHMSDLSVPTDLPVLICGMAGARQGWVEAPYADLPAPVAALAAGAVSVDRDCAGAGLSARDIRILPGLARRDSARPDVMRGEETQLLGLIETGMEGLACMPGTHCKWAEVTRGAVTDFQSYMTGEMFELLSRQSILRFAMPEDHRVDPQAAPFREAVAEALADPGAVFAALFPLRAGSLLQDQQNGGAALARLSGLLIGAEVGTQLAPRDVAHLTLVGQEGLGALYATALSLAGAHLTVVDAEAATRAGLRSAAREIWG